MFILGYRGLDPLAQHDMALQLVNKIYPFRFNTSHMDVSMLLSNPLPQDMGDNAYSLLRCGECPIGIYAIDDRCRWAAVSWDIWFRHEKDLIFYMMQRRV